MTLYEKIKNLTHENKIKWTQTGAREYSAIMFTNPSGSIGFQLTRDHLSYTCTHISSGTSQVFHTKTTPEEINRLFDAVEIYILYDELKGILDDETTDRTN